MCSLKRVSKCYEKLNELADEESKPDQAASMVSTRASSRVSISEEVEYVEAEDCEAKTKKMSPRSRLYSEHLLVGLVACALAARVARGSSRPRAAAGQLAQ
mmetsp:Transcript_129373/g.295211  ORF Transcript_129373/g.295211 Transcript_129373/m.295211 type:complete len:101 (+) Transcript_129373:115-417(+)